ncbi:MAG: cobalt-precorrin 5A hydrolase [candidate division NC10 bacterium]|nr:cobalt-precorrin 5A hydrolase [candidate division NC10 bacterium]
MTNLAVITVTKQGLLLGEKILASEPGAVLYVPAKYGVAGTNRVKVFPGALAPLLAEIYPRYDGFVFLMATGIVVRMIAEYIKDKRYDPAVVVMDITGRFAISLVSGHLGGANALARRMAEITGAIAVVTTGTDVNETIAPDVIAMEIGGEVDDFEAMKKVSAALVDGDKTGVVDLTGVDPPSLRGPLKPNVQRFDSLEALAEAPVIAGIVITNRLLDLTAALPGKAAVILRPKNLVVGVGCNRGTSAEEITAAVRRVLADAGLSAKSVRCLATVEAKRDEVGILGAAKHLGLPLEFCAKEALNAVPDVPNASEAPRKFVGVQGVAEPSALLVSGGRLLIEKVKSGNVTVAVAEAPPVQSDVARPITP